MKFLYLIFALAQVVLARKGSNGGGKGKGKGSKIEMFSFDTVATGEQEVPPVDTDMTSKLEMSVDEGFTMMMFSLYVMDGMGVVAAHLHCAPAGANDAVITTLWSGGPQDTDGLLAEGMLTSDDLTGCGITTIAQLFQAMKDGGVYVNVHTSTVPSGENRGQLLLFP